MSSVNDAWLALQREDEEALALFKLQKRGMAGESALHALLQGSAIANRQAEKASNKPAAKAKAKAKSVTQQQVTREKKQKKKQQSTHSSRTAAEGDAASPSPIPDEPKHRPASEVLASIQRHVQASGSDDGAQRRRALNEIQTALFEQYVMDTAGYTQVFHEIAKTVLKRFSDPVQKCREVAVSIIVRFLERVSDVTPVIAYMYPALMQRIPADVGYDPDVQLFVHNLEEHEAYKRGKAVDRQDRDNLYVHHVVEVAEEVRLELCRVIDRLLDLLRKHNTFSVLHPYFNETVLFVQTHLRDPYPDLKVLACEVLTKLAQIPHYELGLRHFAVGLVRAVLPVLRHRHARVRVAAVRCVHALVAVPNRDKHRGAGTEAIADLVGFREENVIPVAAFYKADVNINHLAELVVDHSAQVRHATATMLADWLTTLPDRFDHQARLLPYLLDFVCDDAVDVAEVALQGLVRCGELYEEEHPDEIIERRQYGVDGDKRINLSKPLPSPFKERPRIGLRLFVRGNTRRFLKALLNELTNWISKTRLNSAHLLRTVIVCCEEHLTMDAPEMLPCYVRALALAEEEKDHDLKQALLEVCELTGRFILPDTYLAFLLPRIRGDKEVMPYGVNASNRAHALTVLSQCILGSRPSTLSPHLQEIIETMTSPTVAPDDSLQLLQTAGQVVSALVSQLKDNPKGAIEAHFVSTGRLTSFNHAITTLFSFLVANLRRPELAAAATSTLSDLAELASCQSTSELYQQFSRPALQGAIAAYPADVMWTPLNRHHGCLESLVRWEGGLMETDPEAITRVVQLCCATVACHADKLEIIDRDEQQVRLKVISDLVLHSLRQVNATPALKDHVRDNWAAQVPSLINAFVLGRHWSTSRDLANRRHEFVELLVSTSLPVWNDNSKALTQVARPLLLHLIAEADDAKACSAHRLQCVQLAHTCIQHMKCLVFSADRTAPPQISSVTAVAKRIDQLDASGRELFNEATEAFRACMESLVHRFEDSDDAVATEAFDIMSTVLCSFGIRPIDFELTCRKLLLLAAGSGSSEVFVTRAEDVLRQLAAFDTQAFTVVLDSIEHASHATAATEQVISRQDVFEVMRDHVHTLQMLMGATRASS